MSPVGASERLARLLALVPWVASHEGPTVAEVCARFSVSEEELLADLNLLFMCGIYPFTPDALIDVELQDGRVWVRYADWFRRPLRVTAPEGLALLAAASAASAFAGADRDGALASAMGKLESVLGAGEGGGERELSEIVEVDLGPASQGTLDLLREAAGKGKKVRIDYYSFGRDGRAVRMVHPWSVFSTAGQWYLRAWCEEASAERLFRVDRIADASSSDQHFPPEEIRAHEGQERGRTALFEGSPDDPLVVLDLAADARWVAERYPRERLEELPGGVWRVSLRVGNRPWLERLLLRLGPSATLAEGDPEVRRAAARRVLARYVADGPAS
ncbi:MAG: helix-turn-helix transcriptional regulator [Acidimicrobiales bacterium]